MNINVQKLIGELVEARVLCNSAMKQINTIAEGIMQGISEDQKLEQEAKKEEAVEKVAEKIKPIPEKGEAKPKE